MTTRCCHREDESMPTRRRNPRCRPKPPTAAVGATWILHVFKDDPLWQVIDRTRWWLYLTRGDVERLHVRYYDLSRDSPLDVLVDLVREQHPGCVVVVSGDES